MQNISQVIPCTIKATPRQRCSQSADRHQPPADHFAVAQCDDDAQNATDDQAGDQKQRDYKRALHRFVHDQNAAVA